MVEVKIAVTDVALRYSGSGETLTSTLALTDVRFDVPAGEFVAIIGPSGCGKSTLLKVICGLMRASDGNVSIDGEAVDGVPKAVGFLFQSDALLPWRTAQQNVAAGAILAGQSDRQAQGRGQIARGARARRSARQIPVRALRRDAQACRTGADARLRSRRLSARRAIFRSRRADANSRRKPVPQNPGKAQLADIIAIFLVLRIVRSPFGRLIQAIHDDESAVRTLGKEPAGYKMSVLIIGAGFAGLAGALQAHYITYIAPDQFTHLYLGRG